MSFAFSAIGTKHEVVRQLEAASIPTGDGRFNEFGMELRDLLVKHFAAEAATAGSGHEYRYVVKANGHGGGNSPIYVQLTIDAHWLPVTSETVNEGAVEGDSIATAAEQG